jgi:iron complex outermembrane receptor protein
MMSFHSVQPRVRLTLCATAVLSLIGAAQAQTSDAAAPVSIERVQITGSSIKRLAATPS